MKRYIVTDTTTKQDVATIYAEDNGECFKHITSLIVAGKLPDDHSYSFAEDSLRNI